MIPIMDRRRVWLIAPQAIKDNTEFVGSTGSTPIIADAAGYHYAEFCFHTGAMDIAMATLIVKSSDDSALASPTSVYTFGGTGKMALPTATGDDLTWALGINLESRQRYWAVTAIPGDGAAGTYAVAWIDFFWADETPSTAAGRGLTAHDFI